MVKFGDRTAHRNVESIVRRFYALNRNVKDLGATGLIRSSLHTKDKTRATRRAGGVRPQQMLEAVTSVITR